MCIYNNIDIIFTPYIHSFKSRGQNTDFNQKKTLGGPFRGAFLHIFQIIYKSEVIGSNHPAIGTNINIFHRRHLFDKFC